MGSITRREFARQSALAGLGLASFLAGCSGGRQKPDLGRLTPLSGSPAPKSLVVCQDGTWDTPRDRSNVIKLYEALIGNRERYVYYHAGVGQFGERLSGGDTGLGTSRLIMDAYEFLSINYTAGDRIYLFGFSRGACAVRSLASFIDKCGLVPVAGLSDADRRKQIRRAYALYLACHNQSQLEALRQESTYPCEVEMVGVWDTVGALGTHLVEVEGLNDLLEGLHDMAPHKTLRHGYHAVAIDERREDFRVTLWGSERVDLEEVWFAGVHSNVGGDYPDSRLSDIALNWMVARARCHSLRFGAAGPIASVPWPHAAKDRFGLQESWKEPLRQQRRLAPEGRIPSGATLHWTVPGLLESAGYEPRNLITGPTRSVYRIIPDDGACDRR